MPVMPIVSDPGDEQPGTHIVRNYIENKCY